MINLSDIQAAAEVVRDVAHHTPIMTSQGINKRIPDGGDILLKAENLQRTGSFKIRGASYRLSLLTPEERAQWILDVKEDLHRKLEEVEDYGRSVDVPFKEFVHDNAVRSLRARIDWLDRMYIYLRKSEAA